MKIHALVRSEELGGGGGMCSYDSPLRSSKIFDENLSPLQYSLPPSPSLLRSPLSPCNQLDRLVSPTRERKPDPRGVWRRDLGRWEPASAPRTRSSPSRRRKTCRRARECCCALKLVAHVLLRSALSRACAAAVSGWRNRMAQVSVLRVRAADKLMRDLEVRHQQLLPLN